MSIRFMALCIWFIYFHLFSFIFILCISYIITITCWRLLFVMMFFSMYCLCIGVLNMLLRNTFVCIYLHQWFIFILFISYIVTIEYRWLLCLIRLFHIYLLIIGVKHAAPQYLYIYIYIYIYIYTYIYIYIYIYLLYIYIYIYIHPLFIFILFISYIWTLTYWL